MTTEPDQQNRELVEPSQALVEQSPGQRSDGWEELQEFILSMGVEEAVEASLSLSGSHPSPSGPADRSR